MAENNAPKKGLPIYCLHCKKVVEHGEPVQKMYGCTTLHEACVTPFLEKQERDAVIFRERRDRLRGV